MFLNSQPHGLALHWAVVSCFSDSFTERIPFFFEFLVKSLRVIFHTITRWCVLLLLLHLKRVIGKNSGLYQSCHYWSLHPRPEVLNGVLFIWGSVLPQESLPRHSFVDMERTLRIIFLSSPWLRSWELSHFYQAHPPPPPTSMHTTRIPVESSQLPTPSPWNGHYGTASYVYLVCVDLLSSLYTYHSVDQNGTQRVMRSFCASISCLALWHWWLKLGSGLSLWI